MAPGVRTVTQVYLDLGDKLRVLFGRSLTVEVSTDFEGDNANPVSTSSVHVGRFIRRRPRRSEADASPPDP